MQKQKDDNIFLHPFVKSTTETIIKEILLYLKEKFMLVHKF